MFFIRQKVVTIGSFEEVRRIWGFNYPRLGEVLTIRDIKPHHKHNFLLLYFSNCEIGLCEKNFAPLLEEKGECGIENFMEKELINIFIKQ